MPARRPRARRPARGRPRNPPRPGSSPARLHRAHGPRLAARRRSGEPPTLVRADRRDRARPRRSRRRSTSPGTTSTATPRCSIAVRIAVSRMYGNCSGDGRELAVDAALAEQLLWMRLLEVGRADLAGRDVRGDRQHRHPGAVGVEEAVDQVQVPRPATRRAHSELAGDRPLRPRPRTRPPPRVERAPTPGSRCGAAHR